uniref:Uncharacterized protein n=1 Tax=Rhizophora mucronata TaxID=61149 RepID=A0A2P2IUM4_RHIMU
MVCKFGSSVTISLPFTTIYVNNIPSTHDTTRLGLFSILHSYLFVLLSFWFILKPDYVFPTSSPSALLQTEISL